MSNIVDLESWNIVLKSYGFVFLGHSHLWMPTPTEFWQNTSDAITQFNNIKSAASDKHGNLRSVTSNIWLKSLKLGESGK